MNLCKSVGNRLFGGVENTAGGRERFPNLFANKISHRNGEKSIAKFQRPPSTKGTSERRKRPRTRIPRAYETPTTRSNKERRRLIYNTRNTTHMYSHEHLNKKIISQTPQRHSPQHYVVVSPPSSRPPSFFCVVCVVTKYLPKSNSFTLTHLKVFNI